MTINYKGFGEKVLTSRTNLTEAGIPVIIAGQNMAVKAETDADFIGFTTYADGTTAGVLVNGYVEVPYTGTTPNYGHTALVSNGLTGVKLPGSSSPTNHIVRVLMVDPSKKMVGFIL